MENKVYPGSQTSSKMFLSPTKRTALREITDNLNSSGAQTPDPTPNKDPLGVEHLSVAPSQHSKNNKISDESSDSSLDYGSANEDSPPPDDSLVLAFAKIGINTPKTDRSNNNSQAYLTPNARNGPSGDLKSSSEDFSSSENIYYSQDSSQTNLLPPRNQKIFNVLTNSFETPDSTFLEDLSNGENCEVGEDPLDATITFDPLNVSHTPVQKINIAEDKSSVEQSEFSQKDSIFHLSLIENNSKTEEIHDKLGSVNIADSFSGDNISEAQSDGIAVISSEEQQEILEVLDNLVNSSVSKSTESDRVFKDITFNRGANVESEANSESLNAYIEEERLASKISIGVNNLSTAQIETKFYPDVADAPDVTAYTFEEENPCKERRDSGASIFVIDSECTSNAVNKFVESPKKLSAVNNVNSDITAVLGDLDVVNSVISVSDVIQTNIDDKTDIVNIVPEESRDTVCSENLNENITDTLNVSNSSESNLIVSEDQAKEPIHEDIIASKDSNLSVSISSIDQVVTEEIHSNNSSAEEHSQNEIDNVSNEICFTNSDASSIIENPEGSEQSPQNLSDIQPVDIQDAFNPDLNVCNTTFEINQDNTPNISDQSLVANPVIEDTVLKQTTIDPGEFNAETTKLVTPDELLAEASSSLNIVGDPANHTASEIVINDIVLDKLVVDSKEDVLPILESVCENDPIADSIFVEESLNKGDLSDVDVVSNVFNDANVKQNVVLTEEPGEFQNILPNGNYLKSQNNVSVVVPECKETVINVTDIKSIGENSSFVLEPVSNDVESNDLNKCENNPVVVIKSSETVDINNISLVSHDTPVEAIIEQTEINKIDEASVNGVVMKFHQEETILSTQPLENLLQDNVLNVTVTKDIELDHIPAEFLPMKSDENLNATITKEEGPLDISQSLNHTYNESVLSTDNKPIEITLENTKIAEVLACTNSQPAVANCMLPEDVKDTVVVNSTDFQLNHTLSEEFKIAEVNVSDDDQKQIGTLPNEIHVTGNSVEGIQTQSYKEIEDQILPQNVFNTTETIDAIAVDISEPMECDDIGLNLDNDICITKTVDDAPQMNLKTEPMECDEYVPTYDDIVKEAQHELDILYGTQDSVSVKSVAHPSESNTSITKLKVIKTPEKDVKLSANIIENSYESSSAAEAETPKILDNTFSQPPLERSSNIDASVKAECITTVNELKNLPVDHIPDNSDSLKTDNVSPMNYQPDSDIDSKSNMASPQENSLDVTLSNDRKLPEINSNYSVGYQIDDLNFNPFVTKSKMANSLDRDLGNTTNSEINANNMQKFTNELNQSRVLQTPDREVDSKNDNDIKHNIQDNQTVKGSPKKTKNDLNTTCVIDEKHSPNIKQPKEVQPELPKNTLNDKAPFASPRPQERRVNQLNKRRISDKMSKSQNLSPMSKCGDLMGLSPVAHSSNSTNIQEFPDPGDLLTGHMQSDGFYPLHDFGDDDFKTPGELFKDPAAFDFLLKCGDGGASSGRDFCKESLLVKFDPLVGGPRGALPSGVRPDRTTRPVTPPPACISPKLDEDVSSASGLAESCSSDSSLCTYNSEPGKTLSTMSSVEQSLGALSLQTQGNQPQHIASNNSIPAHSGATNINVINQPTEKPTQVVTPAFSTRQQYQPSTPLSSKSVAATPKSGSVSSALAAIDRLISLGATTPPPPPVVVQPKETEMDPRLLNELQSVREMLGRQEEELRQANETAASLQKQLSESATREQTLIDRVNEKNRDHRKMDTVMEEYERTISQFFGEREQEKRQWAEEKSLLMRERDEANSHLANMEHSFNDIHAKYERCKTMIQGYKTNEEILKQTVITNEEASKKQLERYEQLRQHAMTQLEIANQEIDTVKRASQSEILKLQAMLKKSEIQTSSLQESLNQKTKDVEDLTAICDELINKVG